MNQGEDAMFDPYPTRIIFEVNSTKDRVIVRIEERGHQIRILAEIDLDAAEADEAITNVAERRSVLRDEVPMDLGPNVSVPRAIVDPNVFVDPKPMPDGRRALMFRHPGFGWIGFSMRQQQVEDMIRLLE
jgi:hypothetical protein